MNNVLATMDDLQQILDRYNSPAMQVMLDPFNFSRPISCPRRKRKPETS